MYVKNFHSEIILVWYNKTLLAWYFKELKSGCFTGEIRVGLQLPFDRFWREWSRSHIPGGGSVLCHQREEGFASPHVTCVSHSSLEAFAFLIWNSREITGGHSQVAFSVPSVKLIRFCYGSFFPLPPPPFFNLKENIFRAKTLKTKNFGLNRYSVWCQTSDRIQIHKMTQRLS